MAESKTPISDASSYEQVGEFWDTHDLSDYWNETHEVEFQVNLGPSAAAHDRGVAPDALLNVWLKEQVDAKSAAK